ncbi:Carboxylesterase NlhH [Roseimaritima multifibrata]|uniref:Carboxylesterase NlhH n=1 Tax=Roseimaritima multifibrata TaxID=1930274 RepID=A0A517ML36_9BACT|nr:alpha/beta hydrolase [Roseimaritima multifibrata]QDS95606.1 Carboxylesterase NlhH [Roseimaritima multifibrata]
MTATGRPHLAHAKASATIVRSLATALIALLFVQGLPVSNAVAAVQVVRDLTFSKADTTDLKCDLYLPDSTGTAEEPAPTPVVVVIHGGAWRSGSKWLIGSYGRTLANNGIAAVVINYRLAPQYPFPAQVDDSRDALVWIAKHAKEYHFDTKRIGVMGYSAGGHLACMLGTLANEDQKTRLATSNWDAKDPRWQELPSIAAVVAGGAPCDFRNLPEDNTLLAYFLGGSRREFPAAYEAASPAVHASKGDPPTLFIHGSTDLIVPIASAQSLHQAFQKVGVPSEFLTIEGSGHIQTFMDAQTSKAATDFFKKHLL